MEALIEVIQSQTGNLQAAAMKQVNDIIGGNNGLARLYASYGFQGTVLKQTSVSECVENKPAACILYAMMADRKSWKEALGTKVSKGLSKMNAGCKSYYATADGIEHEIDVLTNKIIELQVEPIIRPPLKVGILRIAFKKTIEFLW